MVFTCYEILKNYYDILGVSPNATKEQIRSAYRKLSLKFHPDKNNGETYFESMFKNINEANEILSNDAKRSEYDFRYKQFNESGSDSRSHAEFRRREEELRRKQEELARREQELKRQYSSNESTTSVDAPEPGINWGKVSNIFFLFNVFLVGLIIVTKNKNDIPITSKADSQKKNVEIRKPVRQRSSSRTQNQKAPVEYRFTDTLGVFHQQEDSVGIEMAIVASDATSESDFSNRKTEATIGDTSTVKPKWYQFKKRKEWRKNKKEAEATNF